MGAMRKFFAWLGAATLFVLMSSSAHAANDVLKPYVVMILDTSGSMIASTNSGPTSCGKTDNRINHAVCAIYNIVNSYGDMVFAFGRFRETTSGGTSGVTCDGNNNQDGNPLNTFPLPSGGDVCGTQGAFCQDCNTTSGAVVSCTANNQCTRNFCNELRAEVSCIDNVDDDTDGRMNDGCAAVSAAETGSNCTNTTDDDSDGRINDGCPAAGMCLGTCTLSDSGFEVLTPLVDGNNASASRFADGTCNTCSVTTGTDPEIWGVGDTWTPLAASMRGSKRYWEGNQGSDGTVIWQPTVAGFDPINRDPSNTVFLPAGCNPSKTCTSNCCSTQCRPYITILLTDGDETCSSFTNTLAAAAAGLNTTPRNDAVNISSANRTSNLVTITTSTAHPFSVGDTAVVSGVTTNMTFNGTFVVTAVPSTTQVQWTQTGSNSSIGSGGTVRHAAFDNKYRIELKPIGFGVGVGYQPIEDMAHAGGAPDLPGVLEGYYAADESDIQLAISQILADSVRSESCNAADDDCDTRIDEDFPTKGGACTNGQLGVCLRNGNLVCRTDGTGLQCDAVTVTPGTDGPLCNGLDDDCDGRIDENLGCTPCVPTGEICDNKDNDCDNIVDEGLTRSCGQGTCTGTEVCTAGNWGGCTAPPATTEVCNGRDDDCDGVCDGLQAGCSEVTAPCNPNQASSCPQSDSPGDPMHWPTPDTAETMCANNIDDDKDGFINDGCPANGAAETACSDAVDSDADTAINDGCPVPSLPIAQNICRPGTKTCAVFCGATNSYGQCSGEVKPCNGVTPCTDPCNGLDDDCDNKIDEGFVPADCSTNCGVGQTACVNGQITCNSMPAGDDDTCNNVDDDCDNLIDEDWTCANPINGMCPCGAGMVCDGEEKCINGQVVCEGGPLANETCNCNDEDCDNIIDEGTVCPVGSTCTNCQCAFPCAQGEFPCPLGKKCENSFCVNDPCFNITCPPVNGNAQQCIPNPQMLNDYQCVDKCSTITCNAPFICYGPAGECRTDDCQTFPDRCAADESCIVGNDGLGDCVKNPCQGVNCPADKYCIGGTCVGSCADVECPQGQRCRQGVCETDPCGNPCPFGYACNDNTGMCIEDPCKVKTCPQGQWCNPNDGQCEDDPCVLNNITCPNADEVCRGGTCLDPDDLRPDAAGEAHVTVGGGGGCSTSGDGSWVLVGLALLLGRRFSGRKRVSAARGGGVQ